ncbi:hypothetical protein PG994_014992 [Apiospora phragmitis]|uniref:Knr4/Smi1-like domain-containing protein n=1 Tax=Apiospora phragmitis TaxID=2905665 RepID=A0ABR1SX08_9PEZI
MANTIGGTFRSFWHTMTSYDRHSSYDSPYRSGRHVPLNRQSTLTSVATAANESRADITSPYIDETGRLAGQDNSYLGAPAPSPVFSYEPCAKNMGDDGFETISSPGEIPMQSFADGGPPAPPVTHTWRRIDTWAEENYPELWDQLCEGCTNNDINELEHQLDCSLPQDIRDSLSVHDGQERGEWDQWRKVNQDFLLETNVIKPSMPSKAFGGSSNQASSSRSSPSGSQTSNWKQDLLAKQDSVPVGAVQRAYAHQAWIPLVRDWGGNNLAVDLAPGPTGTWGQIILFGRDYDIKYVVAKSWGHFLAVVADDLNSGKWFVDEETSELKLREFKATRVEPSYFDILRWRMDQKHGRTAKAAAKRRSMAPGGMPSPGASPYASPVDAPNGESRGRSLQRLSSPSPLTSPIRPGYGKASPLAQVTEEGSSSTPSENKLVTNGITPTKLVEVETPRPGDEAKSTELPDVNESSKDKEKEKENSSPKAEASAASGKASEEIEEGMKTIEI